MGNSAPREMMLNQVFEMLSDGQLDLPFYIKFTAAGLQELSQSHLLDLATDSLLEEGLVFVRKEKKDNRDSEGKVEYWLNVDREPNKDGVIGRMLVSGYVSCELIDKLANIKV